MKAILISIKPEWTAKILNGEKTVEVRTTAPKCELPIKVYIYCTKSHHIGYLANRYVGKVVASFTMKRIGKVVRDGVAGVDWGRRRFFLYRELDDHMALDGWCDLYRNAAITEERLASYLRAKDGYAWHIEDLQILDKPKELDEFDYPNPSGTRYVSKRSLNGLPNKKHPPQSWCYVEEK